ncbi:hypothetical protein ACHAWF_018406 [Thalassiosira exigua]
MSGSKCNQHLGYGLNARSKRKRGGGLSGFGGEDDSDDSGGGDPAASGAGGKPASGRDDVNRQIAAEQSALRKRAEDAMKASAADPSVYDYDGEYDSFTAGRRRDEEAKKRAAASRDDAPKRPRYISGLLKTAERRTKEQEVIYEKVVAREQAEEDARMQYEGKDKFVTSSYKRRLAEREQWAKEEAERAKREEAEDVTKKKAAGSFLFGGIGRSLLMGNRDKKSGDEDDVAKGGRGLRPDKDGRGWPEDSIRDDHQRRESSRETERWGSSQRCRDAREERERSIRGGQSPWSRHEGENDKAPLNVNDNGKEKAQAPVKTRRQVLEERAVKIREARERYFKRREMVAQ